MDEAWRAGRFRILCKPAPGFWDDVAGLVRGPWGIHQEPKYGMFKLTHLPTGKGIPTLFRRQRAAKEMARELDALGDWSSADIPDGMKRHAAMILPPYPPLPSDGVPEVRS